jgi:anaerobic magnesium-protoporphyrin IX monomethyl ester cyclase
MRVLFLAKLIQDRVLTPYGLSCLSAACRAAGHETDMVDAISLWHVRKAVKSFRPDVLATTTHTARWFFFRDLAGSLKSEFNLPHFLGGAHPTFRPEIAGEPGIDGVCVGEADEAFPELLNRMQEGREYHDVRNWCFYRDGELKRNPIRPLVANLDSLAFPHFALADKYRYSRTSPLRMMLTSRGCMFNCSFCGNSGYTNLYGKKGDDYYRKASPKRVMEEIRHVMANYPCRFIAFFDDHLTRGSDEWAFEFADSYAKAGGPPFSCHMAVPYIKRDSVKALARAGLKWVGMSLECADPVLRQTVLNRHYTNESFLEAVAILHEQGIRTYIGNVIAFPGSTLETDIATLRLNREARVGVADASIFTPFPGTTLGEKVFNENLIDTDKFMQHFHSLDASFHAPAVCDVPHSRYARRLHCLFEIAGDSKWIADHIEFLVRLPLTLLYLIMYKFHNLYKKQFFLFKEVSLPLRTKIALLLYNAIS